MNNNHHIESRDLPFIVDIRKHMPLSDLDEQQLRCSLRWVKFRRGQTIDRQNDLLRQMIFIASGSARTFYIDKGKEYNFSFTFAPHFLIKPHGLISLKERMIFVQFMEDTEVCYIPVNSLDNNAAIATAEIYKFIAESIGNYADYLEELVVMLRMDARQRYEWVINKYPRLLELISITQLASFLNVTKETLYRIRSGKY